MKDWILADNTTPIAPKTTFLPSLKYFGILKANKAPKVPVRVTCFEVLGAAGIRPWDWYSDFRPNVTFMGRRLKEPAHSELADALQNAERKLMNLAKAETGNDAITPFDAGTTIGMMGAPSHAQGVSISGARRTPTSATVSMHMFGLAVDIEYDFNLFISPGGQSNTSLDAALKRARDLFAPNQDPTTAIVHPFQFPQAPALRKLDKLDEVNAQLVEYFALLDNRAKLEQLLTQPRAFPWVESDVDKALTLIGKDVQDISKHSREGSNNKTLEGNLKQHGFTRMPKLLIDNIGLDWGASYGDIHHFDCRNLTEGKKIQKVVGTFKNDTAKHDELSKFWKDHETKTEEELETEFAKKYHKTFPDPPTP